ncbi:MFS transporter [Microlunatus elymi]|uniref:MFS transporter n=1 Tax=Microlunatus elymi TaxID=2596828 RepID=A0A516Q3V1_9ACTN|nr:MFS transporter [Microlunatus elymi]QDP98094.1 MFS transporter [Microlunatus elymi]
MTQSRSGLVAGAANAVGSGAKSIGHGIGAGFGRLVGLVNSGGSRESGLARLLYLEFMNSAGDAAVAIALAGTIFFGTPTDQARPQVALFLAMTMAPLAILAPFIGPFLDRFRHGRRWAIGITAALRAFLCWVLAGVLDDSSVWLFVCALGVLVANKAYAVSRAAAVPRLLPESFTLVQANSRIAIANIVGLGVGGGLAALIARIGPDWTLRFAFLIFIAATVLSILLPARVDSARGETDAGLAFWRRRRDDKLSQLRRFRSMTARLQRALLATIGARLMSGFLTFFLAFLFREHPIGDLPTILALGIVVAASGIGSAIGTVIGNVIKDRWRPETVAWLALLLDAGMAITTTLLYSAATVIAMGFVTGLASRLAKLCYDALVQSDVDESVRTSVFGRSEAVFQVFWVAGGFLGIGLPLLPRLGFGMIAGLLLIVIVLIFIQSRFARPDLVRTSTSQPPAGTPSESGGRSSPPR